MICGVHHVGISSSDLDRSVRFYRDVIGFEVVFESRVQGPRPEIDELLDLKDVTVRIAMLKTGTGFLEIFEYESPTPRAAEAQRPVHDHGINHITLSVTDIDGEYARLKAAGMVFHGAPMKSRMPVRAVYGRDPDGNAIELLEVFTTDWPFHMANSKIERDSKEPAGS
jgi:catechol 2,3-dioxygenase-like lactoylglutathione lyase family enzyme